MYSGPIDRASLLDPQQLIAAGSLPYTFLAFPREAVDEDGMPTDQLVQEYIARVQSHGIQVGIWIETFREDTAYAFVGPQSIGALSEVVEDLRESGLVPDDRGVKRLPAPDDGQQ